MTGTLDVQAAGSDAAVAALNEGLVALQDALRLPGLEQAMENGGPPGALTQALDRWWMAYDRYRQEAKTGLDVTCREGCHWCCLDNPEVVTGVELLQVWMAARRLPDWPQVLDLARELAVEVEQIKQRQPDRRAAQAEVRARGRRCMFLSQDNRCKVYGARPVACRMFVAVTEPDWCDASNPRYSERVNPHLEPARVLLQILAALSHRLGLHQGPTDLRQGLVWLNDQLEVN